MLLYSLTIGLSLNKIANHSVFDCRTDTEASNNITVDVTEFDRIDLAFHHIFEAKKSIALGNFRTHFVNNRPCHTSVYISFSLNSHNNAVLTSL
jgi:hypothetical protein